jgi:hypothetical protein
MKRPLAIDRELSVCRACRSETLCASKSDSHDARSAIENGARSAVRASREETHFLDEKTLSLHLSDAELRSRSSRAARA